jgi:hypothetical protein
MSVRLQRTWSVTKQDLSETGSGKTFQWVVTSSSDFIDLRSGDEVNQEIRKQASADKPSALSSTIESRSGTSSVANKPLPKIIFGIYGNGSQD